jgi:hypothetical protein
VRPEGLGKLKKFIYLISAMYMCSLEVIKVMISHLVGEIFCTHIGETPDEVNGKLKILVQQPSLL